ncbi:hypothetical protein DL96DRAFT_1467433 [Flagelloscypha sp. PMI_526]|nr:hypothetical protein DL96DRAFT_1467433 [Flagelloscypha sp. PMI_526]
METANSEPAHTTSSATDVFSLTDQVLSDKLQFIEEVGFGNWGSVWLAQRKNSSADDQVTKSHPAGAKMAVKLVHRSKTPTTAARVKSLWNEMKIVRTFKHEPHPSIVPFYSFIITPSYALITMAYLPTLVPVEVGEPKAKVWFESLLSGVKFLHDRGVVHNDIKPANILLSPKNVPVLVDFGFAERYDMSSDKAFHSNLSYGTPEYLSPERARGLPHDTRKSDIWSLGVTFFEILTGRTPFEHSDGEQFTTKEDLEKYWARTLKGKWVGEWTISPGVEKLLRRMISPNADLRCNATDASLDAYWKTPLPSPQQLQKISSVSTVVFEKDSAKLRAAATPTRTRANKENLVSPPGLDAKSPKSATSLRSSKSQPKVLSSSRVQPKGRVPVLLTELSPIKGSAPSPRTVAKSASSSAKAAGKPRAVDGRKYRDTNLPPTPPVERGTHVRNPRPAHEPSVLGHRRHISPAGALAATAQLQKERRRSRDMTVPSSKGSQSARDRVKDWEREKERLREMARLEEIEKERDVELLKEQEDDDLEDRRMAERMKRANEARMRATTRSPPQISMPPENEVKPAASVASTEVIPPVEFAAPHHVQSTGSPYQSFRHSIRRSIDMGINFCKASVTHSRRPSVQQSSFDYPVDGHGVQRKESWEDEALSQAANSSLPVIRHAVHNELVANDNRADRMMIWLKNVEQVVEDARQNFAASAASTEPHKLPALPHPPLSRTASQTRSNRSSRLPRKILAANEIFADESMMAEGFSSFVDAVASPPPSAVKATFDTSVTSAAVEGRIQKRMTFSSGALERALEEEEGEEPSKKKEKSKSHGNLLLSRQIASMEQLEMELRKDALPTSPIAAIDRSLFIATTPKISITTTDDEDFDRSLQHVEPYPQRTVADPALVVPDTPQRRQTEGVYDRFLMATSGVKRVGRGYQSEFSRSGGLPSKRATTSGKTMGHASAQENIAPQRKSAEDAQRKYHSAKAVRRKMPPPVSSEDLLQTLAAASPSTAPSDVDEMGNIVVSTYSGQPSNPFTDRTNSVNLPALGVKKNKDSTFVKKALNAGRTVSKRLSKLA